MDHEWLATGNVAVIRGGTGDKLAMSSGLMYLGSSSESIWLDWGGQVKGGHAPGLGGERIGSKVGSQG